MDKRKLNNEIICCRAAVRKARVAVIRKIIKKMKILKTCKLEGVKEKKLKKSERLFEKVKIMKKLKDDEVTKFALRNKDLEVFIKGPESDLKIKSLAYLANHDAVQKKINSIKEQFSDWENELIILLDSLEKKREEVADTKNTKSVNKNKQIVVKDKKVNVKTNPKRNPGKIMSQKHEVIKNTKESSDESKSGNILDTETSEKIEKIEDPFFIKKKVIVPKLVLESMSIEKNEKTEIPTKSLLKNDIRRGLNGKPFKINKTPKDRSKIRRQISVVGTEEEKLHPSWAAKKVKLIKPFQGKKIMFSDD